MPPPAPAAPPAPSGPCTSAGGSTVHASGTHAPDTWSSPAAVCAAGAGTEVAAEMRRLERAAERAIDREGDPGSSPG
ncbi:hypothetical protein [Blastococcus sp. SYSU D00813]